MKGQAGMEVVEVVVVEVVAVELVVPAAEAAAVVIPPSRPFPHRPPCFWHSPASVCTRASTLATTGTSGAWKVTASSRSRRRVRAGSIIGSGTVSNRATEVNGRKEWTRGYSCIAEKRTIETILDGAPATDYMKFGDTVRIEVKGRDGQSVFGAIDQKIVPLAR